MIQVWVQNKLAVYTNLGFGFRSCPGYKAGTGIRVVNEMVYRGRHQNKQHSRFISKMIKRRLPVVNQMPTGCALKLYTYYSPRSILISPQTFLTSPCFAPPISMSSTINASPPSTIVFSEMTATNRFR